MKNTKRKRIIDWTNKKVLKDLRQLSGREFVIKHSVSPAYASMMKGRLGLARKRQHVKTVPKGAAKILRTCSSEVAAHKLKSSRATIYKWRAQLGIPTQSELSKQLFDKHRKTLKKLWADTSLAIDDIAKRLNVSTHTIAQWRVRLGLKRRPQGHRSMLTRMAAVTILRYCGFNGQQIGQALGVTRQRIEQILNASTKK